MSNFKSGSGNLDFGGDEDEDGEPSEQAPQPQDEGHEEPDTGTSTESTSASAKDASSETERPSGDGSDGASTGKAAQATAETYPYFVRRNNVGDERDTRLEVHLRDEVADQEAEFRNDLAEHLDTSEVSKTDAREFALLAAYRNPEQVAELMRAEGFGTFE
ncbi:acyl-CoA dehydrogenase [Halorientalis salina]|uniref:acyl-CoA dehydrogenase n=1 Tax=Halorientalis salina TaxID=2932266 RepID=UPI0010ABFA88|nr:acyl-CoA dehydrogenase [Halorientalis salina]